jgi:quinol monooxygenase YgiN
VSVVLVATFQPTPGRIDDLIEAITSVIPSVHTEDGCELYALHRGKDTLVMIEKWSSRDALKAHGSGPAIAEMGPKLKGLLAAPPEVLRFESIPAGTESQGTL